MGRWEAVHRNNHWLDALALACVGGHGIGQRVVGPEVQTAAAKPRHDDGTGGGGGADWRRFVPPVSWERW